MKIPLLVPVTLLLLFVLGAPLSYAQITAAPGATPPIQTGGDPAATAAAEVWLALVDDGQFAKGWETGAKILQGVVTEKDWVDLAQKKRPPLGKVLSRKVEETSSTTSLPGAPQGQYVVLQYNTKFEHKDMARETVTIALDGGMWKVSGYYIR